MCAILSDEDTSSGVWGVLDKEVRLAIIKICRVFQRICEKEVRSDGEDCSHMRRDNGDMHNGEGVPANVFERHGTSFCSSCGEIIHMRTRALLVDVSN